MQSQDSWSAADAYERYMGRWSRLIATEFVEWLRLPADLAWVEVGCGTGGLTRAIIAAAAPRAVHAFDPSSAYIEQARHNVEPPATFALGGATAIDRPDGSADVAVAGLALNFVPDQQAAVREMARVVRPGGTVAAYVWDYAGEMEFLRRFWDAAAALDPAARRLDEALRFPTCNPDALERLWEGAALGDIQCTSLVVPTVFRDFEDYWTPFLGGQGPAPGYVASLGGEQREALRTMLAGSLSPAPDGAIRLNALAWAARGTV